MQPFKGENAASEQKVCGEMEAIGDQSSGSNKHSSNICIPTPNRHFRLRHQPLFILLLRCILSCRTEFDKCVIFININDLLVREREWFAPYAVVDSMSSVFRIMVEQIPNW